MMTLYFIYFIRTTTLKWIEVTDGLWTQLLPIGIRLTAIRVPLYCFAKNALSISHIERSATKTHTANGNFRANRCSPACWKTACRNSTASACRTSNGIFCCPHHQIRLRHIQLQTPLTEVHTLWNHPIRNHVKRSMNLFKAFLPISCSPMSVKPCSILSFGWNFPRPRRRSRYSQHRTTR